MSCCFSPQILTRAEREAIARLREQRASGKSPLAAAHRAPHYSHPDPIVTFYTNRTNIKPPRTVKPPRHPRPANHPIKTHHHKPRTAHQKKKVMRQAAKRARPEANDRPSAEKSAPAAVLVEKIRNAAVWDAFRGDKTTDTTAPTATTTPTVTTAPTAATAPTVSTKPTATTTTEDKENSIHRFKEATKKRFEHVKNRFANNSPAGERFVLQQTPVADPSDSNNDQYFQDLMKSDS